MYIPVDQLEKSSERYNSWKDVDKIRSSIKSFDEEKLLGDLAKEIAPSITRGNIIGDNENLRKRKQMIESIGTEPVDFAMERAIGNNDSVYSNFIELILQAKSKVGRIVIKEGSANTAYATGFMVSDRLILTNWHVFKTMDSVLDSVVQFYYEYDKFGNPVSSVTFKLDADTFFYSFKSLDYCLIAVDKTDITRTKDLSSIGYIYLDPTLGKLGDEEVEFLNIIHHPEGDYKQLSIRENKFKKILPTTLWYESDTAPGSSGSPVFNDQWQVVALHHMGVADKNDNGDYIDKHGKIIPVIDNQIDASRIHWIANEGIRISVIRKHLQSVFPESPYIKEVLNPSPDQSPAVVESGDVVIDEKTYIHRHSTNSIQVSVPVSILESKGKLNINISTDDLVSSLNSREDNLQILADTYDEWAEERKRIEENMDYSACTGYRSSFLGSDYKVLLPRPQSSIKRHVAKLSGSRSTNLKYYKFSVLFHSDRRQPLLSAINVDGDMKKRKDQTERDDKWIRDSRIGYNIQLDDDYYKKSGFDRGHMSRREDANWGNTPQEAKRNADLTCVYTNACPQVPGFNRSNKKGVWGKLEKIILEKGANEEEGNTCKISVFSGPIFKDNDPVYKDVKIPLEYYKIICWLSDKGKLRVTAFKLSQVNLVGDIDFEELDINENAEFKEYQCSLKKLHKETKIDFSPLFGFDTFQGDDDDQLEIDNEEKLMEILK